MINWQKIHYFFLLLAVQGSSRRDTYDHAAVMTMLMMMVQQLMLVLYAENVFFVPAKIIPAESRGDPRPGLLQLTGPRVFAYLRSWTNRQPSKQQRGGICASTQSAWAWTLSLSLRDDDMLSFQPPHTPVNGRSNSSSNGRVAGHLGNFWVIRLKGIKSCITESVEFVLETIRLHTFGFY